MKAFLMLQKVITDKKKKPKFISFYILYNDNELLKISTMYDLIYHLELMKSWTTRTLIAKNKKVAKLRMYLSIHLVHTF